jgi:hypothetical protein
MIYWISFLVKIPDRRTSHPGPSLDEGGEGKRTVGGKQEAFLFYCNSLLFRERLLSISLPEKSRGSLRKPCSSIQGG